MKPALALAIACLPWSLLHGEPPAPKDAPKSSARTIRVLIAGQRAMPEFTKQGSQYVEVEPATKWIAPTALELPEAPPSTDPKSAAAKDARTMVWPNEVVTLGHYHCPSSLRLRLIRTLAKQPHSPPEITCELGDLREPLIVISAENGGQGWDHPQTRVLDLSATTVPARTVIALNLTRIPLATRFGTEQGVLAPDALQLLHLPASSSEVFRFRVDAQTKAGPAPVANSSYQIGASDRLLLLAIPNGQAASGALPLSLQMILYKPAS